MQKKTPAIKKYNKSNTVTGRYVHSDFILFQLNPAEVRPGEGIFALNDTGKFIWEMLEGEKNTEEIAKKLALEAFQSDDPSTVKEIEYDVMIFIEELLKRKMVIET